jgi:hypothetical protein
MASNATLLGHVGLLIYFGLIYFYTCISVFMLWMGDIVLLSQRAYFCSIHTIWWRFFPPSLMVVVFVTLSNHLNFMWIWWFSILICQIVLFIIIHLFLPYYVYWLVWLWFWHFFKLIRYIDYWFLSFDMIRLIVKLFTSF